ncbi:MAG: hypothetical protein J6V35_07475, partial [Bacteroidales bacterium]|nr:hypothetical protein [Bacteroidales bacterium]
VLYVTYSYNNKYKTEGTDGAEVEKSKTVKQETAVRFDLAELAESGRYGEGFVDSLVGKDIGASHTIKTSFDANDDGVAEDVTFNLTVSRANKENPVTFTVKYPSDYSLASVKGKEVTFYVCVNGVAGTADELLTEEVLKSDKVKYEPAKDDEFKDDLVKSFLNMMLR